MNTKQIDSVGTAPRIEAVLGAIGVGAFAIICTTVQFLRTDLDWIAAPLSYYLSGEYADVVIGAYLALALALVILGIGFYRGVSMPARSAAPALLFSVGGIALAITALSEAAKAYGDAVKWEMIHLAAAETTFLCVTVAMLLQSWWLRRDERWRGDFSFAFGLALVTFVALWTYALDRAAPRGLSQKIVIALILIWLGWASIKLWPRHAGR